MGTMDLRVLVLRMGMVGASILLVLGALLVIRLAVPCTASIIVVVRVICTSTIGVVMVLLLLIVSTL